MNEITTIIKKEMPCDIVKRKKTKKITSSYTVAKDIPSDIIFQVLSKLSIKTSDRFKCVSMSWSSMIHQPEFMKAHTPCDELMEPPSSSLRDEARSVWYALGFDAMDNVYKLLEVSTIANRLVYEILTVESSSRSA
ncbi:hypothetical protein BC332_25132 [Capsicum chinense]|nr:hypothetical protein BC332_25132 [Capsicum chinense]